MKKKIYKYMTRETALFVHVIIAALCLQISIYTLCAGAGLLVFGGAYELAENGVDIVGQWFYTE